MNALTPFQFDGATVRVVTDEHGAPWFVATDVAKILGYRDTNEMTRRLDSEDRGTCSVSTPVSDRPREVVTISEPGLYVAVLGSQKPEAKAFKRWVTHEILPAIRKTGQYGAVAQITRTDLARMVIESEEALAIAAPKAEAFDAWLSTTGDHSVNEAAKILSRHHDILTGERRLRAWMEANGWIYRDGGKPRAYQVRLDQGRLAERAQWHYHPETGDKVMDTPQVRVTARGIDALAKALTKVVDQGELDIEETAS